MFGTTPILGPLNVFSHCHGRQCHFQQHEQLNTKTNHTNKHIYNLLNNNALFAYYCCYVLLQCSVLISVMVYFMFAVCRILSILLYVTLKCVFWRCGLFMFRYASWCLASFNYPYLFHMFVCILYANFVCYVNIYN